MYQLIFNIYSRDNDSDKEKDFPIVINEDTFKYLSIPFYNLGLSADSDYPSVNLSIVNDILIKSTDIFHLIVESIIYDYFEIKPHEMSIEKEYMVNPTTIKIEIIIH
jgi:hypothetical protein